MFPFRTSAQSTTTEQQVYDSATDGIMTVTGQQYTLPQYTGPSATVQYGTEEQGYPRMLRQIEQGELPQFQQETFPEAGTGIMEYSAGATPAPVETAPVEEPVVNPCPPGYQLVNGVCQPIQQDRGDRDRPTYTGPKISAEGVIEGYTSVLGRYEPDSLNATRMLEAEKKYGTELASKIGEVNQIYRNRGVQIKQESDAEIDRLRKVYGEERINQDYTLGNDGKYYRVVATSPKPGEMLQDAGIALGKIIKAATEKGPLLVAVIKDVADKFTNYLTKEKDADVSTSVTTEEKDILTPDKTPILTTEDFGGIDNISNTSITFASNFGKLQNNIVTNQEKLNNLFNSLTTIESDLQTARARRDSTGVQNLQGKREALKNEIQSTKGNISVSKAQSEREEKELQKTINNSIATTTKIGNQTIIQHKDNSGKVVGYSTPDKPNVVNVAGMPPIGPGQQIKSSGGGNNNKSIGGNQTTKQSVSERLSSAKSKAGGLYGGGR